MTKYILASASPRRKQILSQIIDDFTIEVSPADEITNAYDMTPAEYAIENAGLKGHAVFSKYDGTDTIVISADTIVFIPYENTDTGYPVHGGRIFGKPHDTSDAYNMLEILSGRIHNVITGVCVHNCLSGTTDTDYSLTEVKFADLTKEEILSYIATGEPMDKAGAYGYQEKACYMIEKINGCYYNVIGLPVRKIYDMLNKQAN